MTAVLTDNPLTSGNSTSLTISVAAGAPSMKDVVLAVSADDRSGTVHTAGLLVQVSSGVVAQDFGLSVTPASQSVQAGNTALYTVHTSAVGTPLALSLSTSALPASVTSAVFTPDATPLAGQDRTLTLTTSAAAPGAGPASFTIGGTDGTLVREVAARIGIAAEDYALTISPGSGSVVPGGTKQFAIGATVSAGSPANIALSVTGLPAGVTGSFSPGSFTPPSGSTLTLTAAANAAPASGVTFSVHGQDSVGTQRTKTATISVASNDFSISLSPVSSSLTAGTSTTVLVTTGVVGGVAESIALAVSGLPGGVSGAFSPSTITAGGSSTLTLTASASAPAVSADAYAVTGTAASASHGAPGTVTVLPSPPTVQVTVPSSGATVSGSTVQLTATAAPGSGATLNGIDILVDGTRVGSGTSSTTSVTWDSTTVANGSHSITARATDSNGTSATSGAVSITVNNESSGGCSSAAGGALGLLGLLVLCHRRWK
jgi:hypothetical protein